MGDASKNQNNKQQTLKKNKISKPPSPPN